RAEARARRPPRPRIEEVPEELIEERITLSPKRRLLHDGLLGRNVDHGRTQPLGRLDDETPPRRIRLPRPSARRSGAREEKRDRRDEYHLNAMADHQGGR